ncbi:MAG TPA: aminomethyl-transferring glycine dehydrogenase subunit GcvPA [Stellaceae bacterium]|jgi:glycine dehydrogenase subunit 1|nr:aminomethyl-transferring glycine dehydrogenase subunit GcvPA [Stellaceae bacterium]
MRYLPLTEEDRRGMLGVIGAASVDALFADVPEALRLKAPLDLPDGLGEIEIERALAALASRNVAAGSVPSFLGAGAYRHHIPAAVDYLVQRGEFLTSYTPYQPEIAQGTLQTLFEFQTQVALLTDMEVANASMYDGATAAAEAVMMANRLTRRQRAVIAGDLHPHYRAVIETYGRFNGFETLLRPSGSAAELSAGLDDAVSCVVVQNPGFFGDVRDYTTLAEACHRAGALLVIAVAEIVSLGLIKPPGAMGADIVAAEGQSLGNALEFGGPYVGLFATREKFMRQLPGRLAGQTVDTEGRRGFVLTLSAREQHIRREKATSNICTNSGLCALAFSIHLALLGESGLTRLAELNHAKAVQLAERLEKLPGVSLLNQTFFNEFTLRLPRPAAPLVDALAARGILAGVPVSRLLPERGDLADALLVAATELTTDSEIDALEAALREALR